MLPRPQRYARKDPYNYLPFETKDSNTTEIVVYGVLTGLFLALAVWVSV